VGFYPFLPQTLPLSGGTLTGNLTGTTLTMSGLVTENGGTATAGSAPLLTPANSNGVAAQLTDTTRDYMLYLTVGTAGTAFVLAIGPTSGVADTIVSSSAAASGEVYSFRLPAGWFWKWTATTATLANQAAIGC
jgi:hypothetical protein